MREERRREQTKLLNKLKGIETEEEEKKEDKYETKQIKEKKKTPKLFFFIFLIITFVIIYSTYIEPKLLFKVNEYSIKTNKIDETMNGLKIVSFSDIHYGTTIGEKELTKYIKKINSLKPDIIIFTGDLFDRNIKIQQDSINIIKEKFNELEASLYKYAIYGDNDYENKEQYQDILNSSNFTLIDNSSKLLYTESNIPIVISGINDYEKIDYTFINNPIDDIDISNYYKIVLDHEPDNVDNYISTNPDLILTAHSLGGLIRIPKIGGIINKSGSKKHNKNYEKINNIIVYNSYGLGTSNIKIRFNNPPSIDLYRLYLD